MKVVPLDQHFDCPVEKFRTKHFNNYSIFMQREGEKGDVKQII
jgi:hypothetical protein